MVGLLRELVRVFFPPIRPLAFSDSSFGPFFCCWDFLARCGSLGRLRRSRRVPFLAGPVSVRHSVYPGSPGFRGGAQGDGSSRFVVGAYARPHAPGSATQKCSDRARVFLLRDLSLPWVAP